MEGIQEFEELILWGWENDIISYVSAIANMGGGHLVIGVHDSSLEIVGTDTYNYDRQRQFFV